MLKGLAMCIIIGFRFIKKELYMLTCLLVGQCVQHEFQCVMNLITPYGPHRYFLN